MNGMTNREFQKFKRIRAVADRAQNAADIREVKRMAHDWVMSAKSPVTRARRKMASNAIRHAHSHHPDFDQNDG